MPDSLPDLKPDANILYAIRVCRHHFMKGDYVYKPHMACATEDLCAIAGCENGCAYMVALTPYDFKIKTEPVTSNVALAS